MAHFAKPAEGSWTQHYPELGTGPISYEDSISPEHYELERDAIFRRTWLNVGRVEEAPEPGNHFVKDLAAAGSSITVERVDGGALHAFGSGHEPVQVDVWEGFVFVNLDPTNTTPVREHLGKFAAGFEGYPFDQLTQVYKYRADVRSNWKLYIDAFAEFYHAPVLHQKQYMAEESRKLVRASGSRPCTTSSTVPTAWCPRGVGWRRRRTRAW